MHFLFLFASSSIPQKWSFQAPSILRRKNLRSGQAFCPHLACIAGVLWRILNFPGASAILDWKLTGEDWGERKSASYKAEWWVTVSSAVNNGKLTLTAEKTRKRMKQKLFSRFLIVLRLCLIDGLLLKLRVHVFLCKFVSPWFSSKASFRVVSPPSNRNKRLF